MKRSVRLTCLAVLVLALPLVSGCKKRVPENVATDALLSVMRKGAPKTVSAMCGGKTKGLTNPEISNVRINADKPVEGVAHVKGAPFLTSGVTLPSECEGDVEFRFDSSTSTTKKNKVRTNKTTWSLTHIKLASVQTKGISATGNVEEDTDDSEE